MGLSGEERDEFNSDVVISEIGYVERTLWARSRKRDKIGEDFYIKLLLSEESQQERGNAI